MKEIILLGLGGHAKVVTDTIESSTNFIIKGFLDTAEHIGESYRGYKVIDTDANAKYYLDDDCRDAFLCLGYLGRSRLRNDIAEQMIRFGYKFPTIIDKSSICSSDVYIGNGTYVGKNAVINSMAQIKDMCIINTGAVVEHECVIGDYTHISVNATICGGCSVGKGSFVGAGATIIQGISIGSNVIIGAGTTVLKDVPDGHRVVGVYK